MSKFHHLSDEKLFDYIEGNLSVEETLEIDKLAQSDLALEEEIGFWKESRLSKEESIDTSNIEKNLLRNTWNWNKTFFGCFLLSLPFIVASDLKFNSASSFDIFNPKILIISELNNKLKFHKQETLTANNKSNETLIIRKITSPINKENKEVFNKAIRNNFDSTSIILTDLVDTTTDKADTITKIIPSNISSIPDSNTTISNTGENQLKQIKKKAKPKKRKNKQNGNELYVVPVNPSIF